MCLVTSGWVVFIPWCPLSCAVSAGLLWNARLAGRRWWRQRGEARRSMQSEWVVIIACYAAVRASEGLCREMRAPDAESSGGDVVDEWRCWWPGAGVVLIHSAAPSGTTTKRPRQQQSGKRGPELRRCWGDCLLSSTASMVTSQHTPFHADATGSTQQFLACPREQPCAKAGLRLAISIPSPLVYSILLHTPTHRANAQHNAPLAYISLRSRRDPL